jgi:hypothetical protein
MSPPERVRVAAPSTSSMAPTLLRPLRSSNHLVLTLVLVAAGSVGTTAASSGIALGIW